MVPQQWFRVKPARYSTLPFSYFLHPGNILLYTKYVHISIYICYIRTNVVHSHLKSGNVIGLKIFHRFRYLIFAQLLKVFLLIVLQLWVDSI